MKFIIIERKTDSGVHIIQFIFSKDIVHSIMYDCVKKLLRIQYEKPQLLRCASAGFYEQTTGKYHGESETLQIKCHPNTNDIMKMINYIMFFNESPFK